MIAPPRLCLTKTLLTPPSLEMAPTHPGAPAQTQTQSGSDGKIQTTKSRDCAAAFSRRCLPQKEQSSLAPNARRPAQAAPPLSAGPLTPPAMCEAAIANAEAEANLPNRVLASIAMRESGRVDPDTGRARPWPWTINYLGIGHFLRDQAAGHRRRPGNPGGAAASRSTSAACRSICSQPSRCVRDVGSGVRSQGPMRTTPRVSSTPLFADSGRLGKRRSAPTTPVPPVWVSLIAIRWSRPGIRRIRRCWPS